MRSYTAGFLLVVLTVMAAAQAGKPASDVKGRFLDKSTYQNQSIGMTIKLPGAWQFADPSPEKEKQDREKRSREEQSCTGPLCHSAVDIGFMMKDDPEPTIFLLGYKLTPEYLDRRRYPLKKFAEAMLTGSVGGSGWTVDGDITSLQIDAKPAYRLFVHQPLTKGCGYVAESNGYVFMIIGVAPNIIQSRFEQLQQAIEKMKLGS